MSAAILHACLFFLSSSLHIGIHMKLFNLEGKKTGENWISRLEDNMYKYMYRLKKRWNFFWIWSSFPVFVTEWNITGFNLRIVEMNYFTFLCWSSVFMNHTFRMSFILYLVTSDLSKKTIYFRVKSGINLLIVVFVLRLNVIQMLVLHIKVPVLSSRWSLFTSGLYSQVVFVHRWSLFYWSLLTDGHFYGL